MATLEPGEVSVPLSIIRTFVATRDEVYRNWTEIEELSAWFASDGYTVTRGRADARADTTWYIDSESDTGAHRREFGVFREVVAPQRLVFTLTQQDRDGGASEQQTLITVVFADHGTMTEMTFIQTGLPATTRDRNAQEWTDRFDKLDHHLRGETPPAGGSAESELRRDFREWSSAMARGDVNAVMEPVADDVVSYDREPPLVYEGADAFREACRRGLNVDGEVSWDVPDLRVVIRDDIAVTWGLDRRRVETDEGWTETWSRGTRVFRYVNGGWQLIHQHVSFPADLETGAAVTDLTPPS